MARPSLSLRDPWLILGVGACALALGLLVYLTDRPPGHAVLVPPGWTLTGAASFGAAAGWLPSLLHAGAFTLLTAATFPPTRRHAWHSAALWAAIGLVAEGAQHPAIARPLAAWLDTTPAPALLASYLNHGRFDTADLLATVAGAALAAALLLWRASPENDHDHV